MIPRLRDYGMQFVKKETFQLANGPIPYEAPELLARKEFNETVDAYAFGVVLWELFCREDPYKGMMPLAIKEQVLGNEMRPDVTPDIPVVFRRLMGACWNTDPTRRPTFVVIGKILNKPPNELGSYGTGEGATGTTLFAAPKLQGPAATNQAAVGGAAPAVDLVAQLNAPEQSTSMNALMGKISKLLQSNDRLTVQRGLRVVYNLFQKKEYSDQMHLMKGIIPMLIERAKLGNEKGTRDLSLQALGKMCVDPVCAEEFLENLGWPTLIQALDSMDITLELSSTLLMVILLKNARNKDAFVSVKGVPVLVKLLFSDTDGVKTNAVWAASLALENEQTQNEFVAEGGVPILLRLAQSTNPGVVLRVLVSVGLLLTNKDVFDELKDSGVIQRFLRLLSSPSPLLQKHGIEAIARFCTMPELREVLYQANGISNILELLNLTQDPKIKLIAVSALSAFLDDDDHAMYIEQTQALRPVVRLMVSQDAELRLEALRMISKAASHPDLQPQLQSIGAISPLVQLLNAKDKSLRMTALYSLCVATSDDQLAAAVAQADGGSQLVRLCEQYGDDETLELAAETFANIAHSTTGIASLRDCGAFPFLVQLLSHPNPAVVEGVANALVHASSLPEGRLTLVALNAVVPLLELTHSEDEGLRESVLWSTPNWCSDGTTSAIVVKTALSAIVKGLNDAKENIQSICVKAILLLAASSDYSAELKSAGAEAALKRLESGSANKTLGLAAQKAISLL
jgi:HEAT repeat protein